MNSFYYYNPTKLVFGKDSLSMMGQHLPKDTKKVLLHYGRDSIKRSGLYDRVLDALKENGVEAVELSGVDPNPKLSLVREGVELSKKENVDLILAVGGGSVIDSAKAIAAGVYAKEDVWDLFLGNEELEKALPVGVVLTLPASGSESSDATIISNEEGKLKKGLEGDPLRPIFALMNPEITLTLPKKQTFTGIVDILSHVMERYFTNTEDVELTDNLGEGTMKAVIYNAYRLLEDLDDYGARAEIMVSGTIAHSGILGLGREEDWASHRIGHEITALYGTAHGLTLAMILPAWMKYVYKSNPERFARYADKVFDIRDESKSKEELALMGIEKFEEFLSDIDMPSRLSHEDIPYDDFEEMADKCTAGGPVGSFVKIGKKEVLEILELAK